jgi:hypothetical protein
MRIDSSGNMLLGGTLPSAPNISLNANGSASFKGDITKTRSDSAASSVIIRDDYLRIYDNPVSYDDYKISLEKDGSASFTGNVTLAGTVFLGDSSSTFNVIANTNNAAAMHLSGGGSGSANIELHGSNHGSDPKIITFDTNSSERMRIDSSGKLVVGAASFLSGLNSYAQGMFSGTQGGLIINSTDTAATSYARLVFTPNGHITGNEGMIRYNTNDYHMAFWAKGNERMRIDSSGRLLVGASSARSNINHRGTTGITPNVQFETATGSYNGGLSIINNSAAGYAATLTLGVSHGTTIGSNTIGSSGSQTGTISFSSSDGTNFIDCAQVRAEIDGTPGANDMPGRLVFSTTADGASSPTERMRINNIGTIGCFCSTTTSLIAATGAAAGTSIITFACRHSASSTTAGTDAMYIYSNGNIVNTNNSYGAISDIKLKENIVDASSQWDDLKALQVRNYNFIEGQAHTQIGLVAQEVELVSPGLVSESPDRDADGNDLGTGTKSVNYSVLYMKAVKALQEAMERIETLEQRLTDAGL